MCVRGCECVRVGGCWSPGRQDVGEGSELWMLQSAGLYVGRHTERDILLYILFISVFASCVFLGLGFTS